MCAVARPDWRAEEQFLSSTADSPSQGGRTLCSRLAALRRQGLPLPVGRQAEVVEVPTAHNFPRWVEFFPSFHPSGRFCQSPCPRLRLVCPSAATSEKGCSLSIRLQIYVWGVGSFPGPPCGNVHTVKDLACAEKRHAFALVNLLKRNQQHNHGLQFSHTCYAMWYQSQAPSVANTGR